ncbi:glycine/betaine ABC transporter substrate-binding protein [Pantoea vagans]|jgi:osmoprotectant transport system substrate-binding protein|uniref:Glycine betaine ABC transporter substrate-binding protein n=2 Tax=Pantoea vagans TaxID=470934 RepID=A0ABY3LH54_9GAMM|nr:MULTISPECIES: glycine betaine ABC transporter substrate-binding protein [Pantoea]ADO09570.1 Putative ABC transport system, periplasmic solute-binding protein precursor [Pantoea vagans C9-1]MBK5014191.1 glycine betaine ABC transporter substrate-binding protein [Pantoea sp. S62]PAW36530.1 glycine/betaine ABC transporter substrate-binding protein [Pantoea vagans]QCA04381.1 glycine betaine ABC transporter substrate-binding protein [Pantoea vagans]QPG28837.1 glycine betaine ABC transporter subst
MLTKWIKKSAVALTATLLLSQTAQAAAPLVMATKSFTEQHILSAMTVLWLQKKGFEVVPKRNIATTIGRNALLNKQIDMVWEYTGTSLIIFNHISQPMSSQQAYETVKQLDGKLGLVWLNPAPMNNTYAFAMTQERAKKEGINTMSQLVAKVEQVRQSDPDHNWRLGLDLEFAGRSDGLKPLQKTYNLALDRPQIRQMDPGLVYNAIRDEFVDAGLIYTTDGRVKGFNLKVLEDDKHFFPSYNVTPVVRQDVLASHPGLDSALNQLSAQITNEAITELNKRVDIDHESPEKVARDFLQSKNML